MLNKVNIDIDSLLKNKKSFLDSTADYLKNKKKLEDSLLEDLLSSSDFNVSDDEDIKRLIHLDRLGFCKKELTPYGLSVEYDRDAVNKYLSDSIGSRIIQVVEGKDKKIRKFLPVDYDVDSVLDFNIMNLQYEKGTDNFSVECCLVQFGSEVDVIRFTLREFLLMCVCRVPLKLYNKDKLNTLFESYVYCDFTKDLKVLKDNLDYFNVGADNDFVIKLYLILCEEIRKANVRKLSIDKIDDYITIQANTFMDGVIEDNDFLGSIVKLPFESILNSSGSLRRIFTTFISNNKKDKEDIVPDSFVSAIRSILEAKEFDITFLLVPYLKKRFFKFKKYMWNDKVPAFSEFNISKKFKLRCDSSLLEVYNYLDYDKQMFNGEYGLTWSRNAIESLFMSDIFPIDFDADCYNFYAIIQQIWTEYNCIITDYDGSLDYNLRNYMKALVATIMQNNISNTTSNSHFLELYYICLLATSFYKLGYSKLSIIVDNIEKHFQDKKNLKMYQQNLDTVRKEEKDKYMKELQNAIAKERQVIKSEYIEEISSLKSEIKDLNKSNAECNIDSEMPVDDFIINPSVMNVVVIGNIQMQLDLLNHLFNTVTFIDGNGKAPIDGNILNNKDLLIYKWDYISHTSQHYIDIANQKGIKVIYIDGTNQQVIVSRVFKELYR